MYPKRRMLNCLVTICKMRKNAHFPPSCSFTKAEEIKGDIVSNNLIKIDNRTSKPTDFQQLCQRSVG